MFSICLSAQKLELSRAEKYVHNFVIDVELDKKLKDSAARILGYGWRVSERCTVSFSTLPEHSTIMGLCLNQIFRLGSLVSQINDPTMVLKLKV